MQTMSKLYVAYVRHKCPNVYVWVYLDDFLITGLIKDEVRQAL